MLTLPSFEIVRPRTLREATQALVGGPSEAMALGGGTDLIAGMKQALYTPRRLVALRRVAELRGIRTGDDGGLVIGAGTTLAAIESHPQIRAAYPAFAEAARSVASPQIRNTGTLGGNLCLDTRCVYFNQSLFWRNALGYCLKKDGTVCHVVTGGRKCVAAFSADTPMPLTAYGAKILLASTRGERVIDVRDLFTADGICNSTRAPDEVLVEVRLPKPAQGVRASFCKVRPRASIDFASLSVSLTVRMRPDETVDALTLMVGELGARPRTVSGLDDFCVGKALERALIDRVAERTYAQCHPLTNIGVDPLWRREVIPVWVRRAFERLAPSG
jgi:4-hydroxybenzoyl-CoA reductase subunit beta